LCRWGIDERLLQTSTTASERTNVEDLHFHPVTENRMLQAVRSEGGLMVLCFKSLFDEADARKSVG